MGNQIETDQLSKLETTMDLGETEDTNRDYATITALATTLFTPTPTPTRPLPSATPIPLPPPIVHPDWDGKVLETLCIANGITYKRIFRQNFELPIIASYKRIFERMEIQVVQGNDECDAIFTVELEIEPKEASYSGVGLCATGAEVDGKSILESDGKQPISIEFLETIKPPEIVATCPQSSEAPFNHLWPRTLVKSLYTFWGIPSIYSAIIDNSDDIRYATIAHMDNLILNDELDPKKLDVHFLVPVLIKLLREENFSLRKQAAYSLRFFGNKNNEVISALEDALEDEDWRVKITAEESLEIITGVDW